MIGDLPINIEQTLMAKIAEQIESEIDFEILYGELIVMHNGKKYIRYDSHHMLIHPSYQYIKIKCELKKVMKVINE